MGLYNFKLRFVPAILSGKKTHTIRALRKHEDRPGSIMHLYTGLRQKGTRLLGRYRCVLVQDITIDEKRRVAVDGVRLSKDECDALARSDGFGDFVDMMIFWTGRRPFTGRIYHWNAKERR